MIDYLQMNISYLSESELLRNSFLDWHQNTDLKTGEMVYPIIGHYHNMKIKINPTFIELSGSIHMLYNIIKTGTKQNHNDFNFAHVIEMIHHLRDVFTLDLGKTIIQNLECGLNIEVKENPTIILRDHLIVWDHLTPTVNKDNKTGKYIEYERTHYKFKMYDKGKQQKTGTHIIRIETHIRTNEKLRSFGLKTLQDLTNGAKIWPLLDFLTECYQKTVIIDKISRNNRFDDKESQIIKNGINPMSWTSFENRTARKRFKDKFNEIIEKNGLNQIYKEIEHNLISKGRTVIMCNDLHNFEKQHTKTDQNETLRFAPYIKTQNVTSKKCIITGIEITHQKDDSLFLSEASVLKIYETNRKEFDRLKYEFGPRSTSQMSLKNLCYYIAHNIRNKDSNKRHEIKRKSQKYMNSLFPLNPVIDRIPERHISVI